MTRSQGHRCWLQTHLHSYSALLRLILSFHLLIVATAIPDPPDFIACSQRYGLLLDRGSCELALDQIEISEVQEHYSLDSGFASWRGRINPVPQVWSDADGMFNQRFIVRYCLSNRMSLTVLLQPRTKLQHATSPCR